MHLHCARSNTNTNTVNWESSACNRNSTRKHIIWSILYDTKRQMFYIGRRIIIIKRIFVCLVRNWAASDWSAACQSSKVVKRNTCHSWKSEKADAIRLRLPMIPFQSKRFILFSATTCRNKLYSIYASVYGVLFVLCLQSVRSFFTSNCIVIYVPDECWARAARKVEHEDVALVWIFTDGAHIFQQQQKKLNIFGDNIWFSNAMHLWIWFLIKTLDPFSISLHDDHIFRSLNFVLCNHISSSKILTISWKYSMEVLNSQLFCFD